MLYNIDFTAAALFVLAALYAHYVRNGTSTARSTRMFPVFMIYTFSLGVFDIVDIAILSNPDMSVSFCLTICSIYMVCEIFTAPLLTFFLPLAVNETSNHELALLHILLIPAYACIVALVFFNPQTGWLFSISDNHYFVMGPASISFFVSNAFYLVASAFIVISNRKRVDSYRKHSILLMAIIGLTGIVSQALLWNLRLTVFIYALLTLEMYLSYLIPEKRFDALTDVFARKAFTDATAKMLARRSDTDYVMACTKVREFKAINELYSAQVGDKVLVSVAHRLRDYVDGQGTLGRLQSDHFAFCVPASYLDMDALGKATSREELRSEAGCDIDLVFGIYPINEQDIPVDLMCNRAQLALSEIDKTHVRRFARYNEVRSASFIAEHEMNGELESSLEHDDFEIYLQPIIDLATFDVAAAEALVRWRHPTKGLLPPDQFIPTFERNGLIARLDAYVWESVCKRIRFWIDTGMRIVPISVNISRADLNPQLACTITALVDRYRIPHSLIRFEITESAYIEEEQMMKSVINQLHEAGFSLLLDDFGSGYSSLAVLENLPFDSMKVDRVFLLDVMANERSRRVLDSTISLANDLGLSVITEGVETQSQALLLRDMGSRYAQGYYFSRPKPISDFEKDLVKA